MASSTGHQDLLRRIAIGTSAATGDELFRSLVKQYAASLSVRYALVARSLDFPTTRVRTIALCERDKIEKNIEYALGGTPCDRVIGGETVQYVQGVQQQFPDDELLVEMEAECYLGVPLRDSSRQVIGHLAVLDDKPLELTAEQLDVVTIFGSRAAAELERMRSDEHLRLSQDRMQLLVQHAPDAIGIVDAETMRFVEVNEASTKLTGLQRDALLQLGPMDITPPTQPNGESSEEMFARYAAMTLAGDHPFFEWTHVNADGELIPCEVRMSRLPHPDRIWLLGCVRDMREFKESEARRREKQRTLQLSEARQQLLLSQLPGVLWTTDDDLRFTSSLGAGLTGLGLEPDQTVGMSLFEYFQTQDETFKPIAMHREALAGRSLSYEIQWQSRTYQCRVEPFIDDDAKIVGVIGAAYDITEINNVQVLREGHNRVLQQLASGASLGVVLHSLAEMIEQVANGMLCSILLLDEDGQHLRHGTAPSLPDEYNQQVDGLKIGPTVGSCGTAAFKKCPVIVTDTQQDPLWEPFRELAGKFGLRACWSQPILNGNGNVLGTFAMYYDQPRGPTKDELKLITGAANLAGTAIQRRREEQALADSEFRFRQLADNIDVAFFVMAVDWSEMFYCSPAFDKIWGISRETIYKNPMSLVDRVHPEDRAYLTDRIRQRVRGELQGQAETEYRILRPDGSERWVRAKVGPIKDEDGKIYRLAGTIEDITDRRQVGDALRLTQFAVENAAEAMFQISADGRILDTNKIACQRLGYSRDELLKMRVADFAEAEALRYPNTKLQKSEKGVSTSVDNSFWGQHWKTLKRSGHLTFECRHRRKDGSTFPIEISSNYVEFEENEFIFAFARDISKRRQAEEQSQQLLAQLAHLQRIGSMGEMASTLAHEVNQPLGVIANYAGTCSEMIDDGNAPLEDVKFAMTKINEQALLAGAITQRLKSFVSRTLPKRSTLDVNELMREVQQLLRGDVTMHSAKLHLDLQPDLPCAQADRIQIQQVVFNLVRNALEALGEVTERYDRTVTIRTSLHDAFIHVHVSDCGPGIDSALADQLFEPYHTTKPNGLGMGLNICRTIVEAHEGSLTCEPKSDGIGTAFRFALPLTLKEMS